MEILGCFGNPTILTPHLDQMAKEGMRFTQFYVGAAVCSPSRAALLTGRLPVRFGLAGTPKHDVFFQESAVGLPLSEITIAKALKAKNYETGIIGKWHLGDFPPYMPNSYGFDYYYGLPYSNDMQPLPLYRNKEVIEENPDQSQLTQRYTKEALAFITKNKNKPFFLYYASNSPHTPLHASKNFLGKSKRGLYGDVVEELDWSVGEILRTLKQLKLDKNTLVVFTSDNGPWLIKKQDGGSAGMLFEGKQSTYEGGMREPAIFWWPGTIRANQINLSLAASMDLFPTILNMAGIAIPKDRVYDGTNLMPLLTGKEQQVRNMIYYYNRSELFAIRKGPWKAHFTTKPSYSKEPAVTYQVPLLYNIDQDPSEKYNVNQQHPDIVANMIKEYEKFKASIVPVFSIMDSAFKK